MHSGRFSTGLLRTFTGGPGSGSRTMILGLSSNTGGHSGGISVSGRQLVASATPATNTHIFPQSAIIGATLERIDTFPTARRVDLVLRR
jgi:hypothetical protein